MKNSDRSYYTVDDVTSTVPVSEFRARIDHLFRVVNVDFHACASHSELMRWAEVARRRGAELIHTGCKRAKAEDWDRRERAIDRSASLISRVARGEIKRPSCPPKLRVVS